MEVLPCTAGDSENSFSHGLDRAMQARLAVSKVLAKHGYTEDVPMPDTISTKAKAQEYIGLDMDAERAAKEKF